MTQSIWKAKAPDLYFPELRAEIEVDVAIIGGGITGITTAHTLKVFSGVLTASITILSGHSEHSRNHT